MTKHTGTPITTSMVVLTFKGLPSPYRRKEKDIGVTGHKRTTSHFSGFYIQLTCLLMYLLKYV